MTMEQGLHITKVLCVIEFQHLEQENKKKMMMTVNDSENYGKEKTCVIKN